MKKSSMSNRDYRLLTGITNDILLSAEAEKEEHSYSEELYEYTYSIGGFPYDEEDMAVADAWLRGFVPRTRPVEYLSELEAAERPTYNPDNVRFIDLLYSFRNIVEHLKDRSALPTIGDVVAA